MKCDKCKYEIGKYEHYVRYQGHNICETCFFNIALLKLGATEMQNGYEEIQKAVHDNLELFGEE